MNRDDLAKAEEYLINADPILGELIKNQAIELEKPENDYFYSLCRSIVGQQVSVAAANTIFDKFKAITNVEPHKVYELSESEIKTIGLSRQKSLYLRDLAKHFINNPKVYDHLGRLPDDDVIEELVLVKGIGVWTAQMFLIFTLNRPDVFAPEDLGLQRAMSNLYGWEEMPGKEVLVNTSNLWQPYRTVACRHLWQSLSNLS